MQIKIDIKILIFLLVFYISNQLKIYILLMIFACIHELGHMILGKKLGFGVLCFEVKPIGFSISLDNKVEDYNKKILKGNLLELKKIFIYSIGPATNIIVAIIASNIKMEEALRLNIIYINLAIAFFNMIPIYPLDGGRILKSIFCIFFGLKKSYILINKISKAFVLIVLIMCSFLVIKVHNIGIVVMSILLICIYLQEARKINFKLRLYELINRRIIS